MLSIEGQIVNHDKTFRGRIEIGGGGLISSVGKETGQADIILDEELIFPGFVDLHVHAREDMSHTFDYKEDFTTAGQAAINGGVAAFAEMPNNPVPPLDEKSYAKKRRLAEKAGVDVLLYAGIGANTSPLSKKVPYKVYMGKSVGDLFFESFGDLDAALEKYRGQNVSFHCEDPEILAKNRSQSTHVSQRPKEAEISAIDFALKMVEKYNLQGKICHLSTKEGLQKITAAKKSVINITCEVTPHHLYFDETMHLQMNPVRSKTPEASADALTAHRTANGVNPPLRAPEDRLALIDGLREGRIDYLATDHAPHTIDERDRGISGLPNLDTYGPFITWLLKEHNFTPNDIARVCSYNPGQFINQFLSAKYGKIAEGYTGSLTVIGANQPIKIQKSTLKTKCGWSPFEGMEFPGRVVMTIIKGKILSKIVPHQAFYTL